LNYCIIIPNYNHTEKFADLIQELVCFELPVLVINDGSNSKSTEMMRSLAQRFTFISLIEHEQNQGKGGAVQTGLKAAITKGFTHALQIDADGQHDLNDINKLIEESQKYPKALISGKPVYDESIPKHRYYARNITHFWVWVETLSFNIKDTMCGYRIYPLRSTVELIGKKPLGLRMDFDIEVMVKLYWKKVDIRFLPTAVEYPEDGISHFRAFEDNVLISWMHTRLFFGMLIRIPSLIFRKFT